MKTILALALAALAAAEPEAKPEADAHYGYGYGLGGYYAGYRTYGLGYSHGLYYGKREAEAEPYYAYAAHACPCCEHLRRRPCRLSRRCPRRRVPRRPRRRSRRLQLRPGLPLRLSLHRWHCSRRHPRCRRCLRRCWTLRRQLRWNRPCCQEGGRGCPLLLRRILRTWIRTRLQELRIRSRIRPWILLGLDSARTS